MSLAPRGGYMRVRARAWEPEHYAATWSESRPAPEWWAEIDVAWQHDRGELMSIRKLAAFLGWTRRGAESLLTSTEADRNRWDRVPEPSGGTKAGQKRDSTRAGTETQTSQPGTDERREPLVNRDTSGTEAGQKRDSSETLARVLPSMPQPHPHLHEIPPTPLAARAEPPEGRDPQPEPTPCPPPATSPAALPLPSPIASPTSTGTATPSPSAPAPTAAPPSGSCLGDSGLTTGPTALRTAAVDADPPSRWDATDDATLKTGSVPLSDSDYARRSRITETTAPGRVALLAARRDQMAKAIVAMEARGVDASNVKKSRDDAITELAILANHGYPEVPAAPPIPAERPQPVRPVIIETTAVACTPVVLESRETSEPTTTAAIVVRTEARAEVVREGKAGPVVVVVPADSGSGPLTVAGISGLAVALPQDLMTLLFDLDGIGGSLTRKLADEGVMSTAELLAVPSDELRYLSRIGSHRARRIHAHLRDRWGVEPGCLAVRALDPKSRTGAAMLGMSRLLQRHRGDP